MTTYPEFCEARPAPKMCGCCGQELGPSYHVKKTVAYCVMCYGREIKMLNELHKVFTEEGESGLGS